MALTTLSDLKTFLGITDTSEDTLLSLLITQVSDAIQEYCGRTFGSSSYTEFYCGDGKPYLSLNQRPVTSISNIYLDNGAFWGSTSGSFSSGTLLNAGVDYALVIDQPDNSSRCGLVFNINGWWDVPFTYTPGIISPNLGPGVGNIQVTYTAGYASVPTQIELAANMAIARIRQYAPYGAPLSSERYEEYGYSLAAQAKHHIFTPEVTSLLSRFRDPAIA
jgi:hypothetical protein